MFTTPFKISLLILLFVAFLGQARAFVISTACNGAVESFHGHITDSEHQTTSSHDDKNHTDEGGDCCDDDCCQAGCLCVGNTCSGSLYLIHNLEPVSTSFSSEVVLASHSEQRFFIISSPYRPPIFTS